MVKHLSIQRNACDYVSLLSHQSLEFQYIMRYDVVPSTPTYLMKNIVNSPSVSAEVKKLANISYYIFLGTKTNELKCSTHFASSRQIQRS